MLTIWETRNKAQRGLAFASRTILGPTLGLLGIRFGVETFLEQEFHGLGLDEFRLFFDLLQWVRRVAEA